MERMMRTYQSLDSSRPNIMSFHQHSEDNILFRADVSYEMRS